MAIGESAGHVVGYNPSRQEKAQWDAYYAGKKKSATAAGEEKKAYTDAANPALAGLLKSITGGGNTGVTGGMFGGPAGQFGGGATGGGGAQTGGPQYGGSPISGGSRLPSLTMPDQSKASAAAFAGAKDRVGQTSRASLDALRGELGASGMLGGGAEGQLTRDVIQSGAGELGQVSRDLAGKEADLSADFAKTNYAGGITQRGQDVSAAHAQAQLAQEQRLADASLAFQKQQAAFQQQQAANAQQMQLLQMALGGLQGGGGGLY